MPDTIVKKMNPLVSVCIPAYNCGGYVEQTITSILQQTYQNIEIIVCNDGSTDNTGYVLDKIKAKSGITLLHTSNRGQCAAANLAYENSKGEYIKFFDADDLMNSEHIKMQVESLLYNEDCIAAAQVKRFYNDDISTAIDEPLENWQDLLPMDWLLKGNGHGLGMMQCGMFMIPRHFIETGGLWNESLSQINDFEFFPRLLLQAGKILFTEDAKVFYRSGLSYSLSKDLSKEKLDSAHKALLLTTERLLKYENSERVKIVLSGYWRLWTYHFYLNAPDLYKNSLHQLKLLGNHNNHYYSKNGSLLVKLIGWKNHKRLKRLLTS